MKNERFGLVLSHENLNPEFRVKTLYPNAFESGVLILFQCNRFFDKLGYFFILLSCTFLS